MAFIRASQSVGIPLSVIAEVLGFLPKGIPPTLEFWIRASECRQRELNERIAKLQRMRDRLTQCIGCGCLSFAECALVNPHDTLADRGPGPHQL